MRNVVIDGDQRNYIPNFIAHFDDGRSVENPLWLILEITDPAGR